MGPSGPAPTVEEQRWIRAITNFGCVACWLDGESGGPPAVHHITHFGRRLGHRYTLPLCDPGHHQPDVRTGKVALHPGKSRGFIAAYGPEFALLRMLERRLGFRPAPDPS